MRRIAVYRVLYGEDFIKASINTIQKHVDEIYIFWSLHPWGTVGEGLVHGVRYRGRWIEFPSIMMDGVVDVAFRCNQFRMEESLFTKDGPARIRFEHMQLADPANQVTAMVNRVLELGERPDTVLFLEPDHVFEMSSLLEIFPAFESPNAPAVCTLRQIEYWHTRKWRVPERPQRVGPVLYDLRKLGAMPETGRNGSTPGMRVLISERPVSNYGFCVSPKTMLWKHLTAMAFAQSIGDDVPNEGWFERWLNWKPGDRDLEMSVGHESDIPEIIRA